MSDERERALAEYRESLDLGESVDNEDFRAGYDAAEAKSQERIRELDAELDQKHAKLVEVADKLRAARGVIAATQKVIDWNVKHHGSPAIGYREIEGIFRALSTPPPIHEMPGAVTDPDAPDEIDRKLAQREARVTRMVPVPDPDAERPCGCEEATRLRNALRLVEAALLSAGAPYQKHEVRAFAAIREVLK